MKKQPVAVWTRRQRMGFIVLLLVLTLILLFWRILPRVIPAPQFSLEDDYKIWQNFKEENQLIFISEENQQEFPFLSADSSHGPINNLFEFDPNTVTEEGLTQLGIPISVARTIIKYRSKGGRFYKREDLRKIYTLSEEDYNRVAPYVIIPPTDQKMSEEKRKLDSKAPKINLNTADAEMLMTLKGIGPVFSNRIVKYRNLLGGFVSVEQLKEVYGFPDSTYEKLKGEFVIDGLVEQLNLNRASEGVLAKHPYIDRVTAKNIILVRERLGNFSEISQLRQVPLISEEKYRKIAPYLSL